MPDSSIERHIAVVGAIFAAAVTASLAYRALSKPKPSKKDILAQLPPNLDTWRQPGTTLESEEKIWQDMDDILQAGGLTRWPHYFCSTQRSPNNTYTSPGYSFAIPSRGIEKGVATANFLKLFDFTNSLSRAVRTREGHDAIMRIIVIKDEGKQHLDILRKVSTTPQSLLSNNHTLPMLQEFYFEHLTFGIFPKVGGNMEAAYGAWAKNSVGDILDMVIQALEGLAFIHGLNVAHRDAFKDNFLVQWHPESMRTMTVPVSRPRVFLIDFEVGLEFQPDCPPASCVCIGCPLGGSFTQLDTYSRPRIPEMSSGEPYNPFKLDVWQLGNSLENFRSAIEPVDEILANMASVDPASRLTADEALSRLGAIVHNMSPLSLLMPPTVIPCD
ncbi:hypothetical protein OF83DRAFT_1171676 [Amylostereum chailletii]|nr:hypothetical protein OF83DRAFT_1171676 [Amylostereum chailletii]